MTLPYRIVLGNEKGGSGKSTTAMHIVSSLLYQDQRVGVIDLDGRQSTLNRYVQNRFHFIEESGTDLPVPVSHVVEKSELRDLDAAEADEKQRFEAAYMSMIDSCDVVIIDCPGSDSFLSRLAHTAADTIVTPVNDSFVDLDLLARIDADSLEILGPSLYAERVWNARQRRMSTDGSSIDWVVLRNRLGNLNARNKAKVDGVLEKLAKRIGFRYVPGLSERVIYRELFLKGLTLMDLRAVGGVDGKGMTMSQIAARQEMRDLLMALNLPMLRGEGHAA